MSRFSAAGDRRTLADYSDVAGVYPAGRLAYDSEGLMQLTDDGALQARSASDDGSIDGLAPREYRLL